MSSQTSKKKKGKSSARKGSNPFQRPSSSSQGMTEQSRATYTPNTRLFQQMVSDTGVAIKPKLLKRFYESLALLHILGQNRGDRTNEDELELEPDPAHITSHKLRRSFTKHLAYLCDYEKGGDTTCAIALQQTPELIVYHFASNKGSNLSARTKDRTREFLDEFLTALQSSNLEGVSTLEPHLFSKSVTYSSARISDYSKFLAVELKYVLNHTEEANIARELTFINWLAALQDAIPSPTQLCYLCYEIRNSDMFHSLAQRSSNGAQCARRFETIRHYIGRLSHTMKAIKVTVSARIRLPQLFDTFKVVRASSPPTAPPPLEERNPSLFDLAGRLVGDTERIANLRDALEALDTTFQLSPRLDELCTSRNWRPRVHAELILLDLFWTKRIDFVDGDRYIGCSKAACYCCYHYIIAHPGRFVVPACHNNHWLNWRPPDIQDPNDKNSIQLREKILNEMVKKIRDEVLDQIQEQRGPRTRQPDSNTEISSIWLRSIQLPTEEALENPIDAPSPSISTYSSPDDSVLGHIGYFEDNGEGSLVGGRESSPGIGAEFELEDDEDSDDGVTLGAL